MYKAKHTAIRGLYAILDVSCCGERDPVAVAEALVGARPAALQLRAKELPAGPFEQLAVKLRPMTRSSGVLFIVNDRVDVALVANADGVHLGQEDLPVDTARALLGPERLIGLSTHEEAQVRNAVEMDVDYIGFGPIFTTRTKANPDPIVGLEGLRRIAPMCTVPIVAIGGVNRDNARAVRRAGAHAVAVISDLLDTADVSRRAIELARECR